MTTALEGSNDWVPSFNPFLIALAVMIPTFMVVLDTSVANVALPNICGSFSSSQEEVTWVLTSYLVANALILPTTAWFGTMFGRKRFFIICIIIFTVASMLCGIATSLDMLVLARILQGLGGGAIMPISQSILMESFPWSKRGIASAVYGIGVVFAPIIGPTLGGWLTDNYSWEWVFYINIPFGIIAILLCNYFIEDPPYIKVSKNRKIDYIGFSLMAVWLITLQIILDKGQRAEWFAAPWICWFAVISITSMLIFIFWELREKDPIVKLSIFKDRNFALGTVLSTFLGAVLYGTLAMLPLFLQNLLRYPAEQSGIAISPRGIGSMLVIVLVGALSNKVDDRLLIAIGFGVLSLSCFMLGNLNFNTSMNSFIWPNILNGAALGFIFIPLTTITVSTITNKEMENATGIFSLTRSIGGSIGISIVSTFLSRNAQIHQNYMVSHISPTNPAYQERIHALTHFFASKTDIVSASKQSQAVIYSELIKQSNLWGFVDNFRLFGIICLVIVPTVFLVKRVKAKAAMSAMH